MTTETHTALAISGSPPPSLSPTGDVSRDYLTVFLNNQLFGIPVLFVQDVLGPQRLTRIPLTCNVIEGALNLRGRIVTAINMRNHLRLPPADPSARSMSVVIDYHHELFSLIFDRVGDVLTLEGANMENSPPNLDAVWQSLADGIYRLENRLLVVVNVEKLIADIMTSSVKRTV